MNTKNKKILGIVLIVASVVLVTGGGIALYMFNMPHRDVQSATTDISLKSSDLVTEYLTNPQTADNKYLADDGESKILEVKGVVAEISEDYNGQKVILLKSPTDKAGVSCTFTAETNENASKIAIGQTVTIKGVIRSGASYDEDLELYENVILDKSDLVL